MSVGLLSNFRWYPDYIHFVIRSETYQNISKYIIDPKLDRKLINKDQLSRKQHGNNLVPEPKNSTQKSYTVFKLQRYDKGE